MPVRTLSARAALTDAIGRLSATAAIRAALAATGLLSALAVPGLADEAGNLTVGPILAPTLVAPGWIADHAEAWTRDRPAYAASCRTDEVATELRYLEALVARDQDVRDTARSQLLHPVVEGDSSAKRHTDIAAGSLLPLDNDITAIDRLFVKLAGLPPCGGGSPAPETARPGPVAPSARPQPPAAAAASTTIFGTGSILRAPAPDAAATAPDPAAPPASTRAPQLALSPAADANPAAAAPSASPQQATAPEKPSPVPQRGDIFVVRFDSKLPGLTPSGIRALDAALRALDGGREVQIAIDGCGIDDSAANGVDCAELVRRLKKMLADRGVDRPDELIAKSR